ncbi:MAG: hypothetical protein ACR2F8_08475 [Caulobacteraceae bacterium]
MCTWAGLLIEAGRFDLLDRVARAGHLDQPRLSRRAVLKREASPRSSPPKVVDIEGNGELEAAFQAAFKDGNNAVALRLAPYVGRYQAPNDIVRALLPQGRADLASLVISTHLDRVARSPSEALLWWAAARAGQGQALAFLVDFGGDLNLISTARLQVCKRSAEAGNVGALFACVKAASEKHAALVALMTRHLDGPFMVALAGAGDLRERDKRTLIMEVAARGTPAMVRALLARGANPGPDGTIVRYGSHPTAEPYTYGGLLAVMAGDWARSSGYADRVQPTASPLQEAIARGDLEIVRVLADAAPGDLVWQAERLRDEDVRGLRETFQPLWTR